MVTPFACLHELLEDNAGRAGASLQVRDLADAAAGMCLHLARLDCIGDISSLA